jgi:DNA-binding LacI/PurR family transcriptional regulator
MKVALTMQDVARASGYSRAAVSMALRGDRSIPEATRERIREVAGKLGYRPSPLVAALMSRRRHGRAVSGATMVIAYLTSHPPENPWRQQEVYRSMFAGASARAAELGYRLEEFSLGAKGMTPGRLREILRTRQVHAVLVAPLPRGETRLDFDCSSFAVVGLGLSVQVPLIERISNHLFESAALAVARCAALGYRRIGFTVSHETSHRLGHYWLAGYRFALEQHGLRARLPPLITDLTDELAPAMPAWLRAHRPDVVILGNSEERLVVTLPPAIGVVDLSVERRDGARTGIFQNHRLLGAIAVEHLVGKLHAGILGPLCEARIHLVAGDWVPGASAPGPGRRRPLRT